MAQRIASSFPLTSCYLVGPIGPRSQALLHPSIEQDNSTRIVQDELHVIMEYKQGEILGEYVAPSSSRFITSHDQFRLVYYRWTINIKIDLAQLRW
jgi:ADP-dependent glucokinase